MVDLHRSVSRPAYASLMVFGSVSPGLEFAAPAGSQMDKIMSDLLSG